MTLQIQNLDKIIGHTHRWYHWKIIVRAWKENNNEYLFTCTLCDLKNMNDEEWVLRLCRRTLTMFAHKADHSYNSVTQNRMMEMQRIGDLDLFVKEMAHTINTVI